jgi:hypothetical protein
MPLGFAKSVFTTKSAGPTRDGEMRAFTNDATQPGSSGFTLDKAAAYTVSHSTAPFSSGQHFSMVYWFRLAQEAGNIDSPASRFIYMTDSDQSDLWGMVFGYNTNISYMNCLNPSGNKLVQPYGSSYAANSNFMSAIADGAWHCIMVSMDSDAGNGIGCWFLDGNGTNEASGNALTNSLNASDFKYIALRNNNGGHNTNYTASFESGPGFELGPIWLYDSYIDFTNATNRGYFYNASNVDGFVDGGTDGTQGGAPTPNVYMYHDASTLQVSSSQTPTVNTVTSNGGAIVVIPSSGGPGSGDTI